MLSTGQPPVGPNLDSFGSFIFALPGRLWTANKGEPARRRRYAFPVKTRRRSERNKKKTGYYWIGLFAAGIQRDIKKPLHRAPRKEGAAYLLPYCRYRGHSSVGRALQWHCRGQGFDSPWLHQSAGTNRRDKRAYQIRDLAEQRISVSRPLVINTQVFLRFEEAGSKFRRRRRARSAYAEPATAVTGKKTVDGIPQESRDS